MAEAISKQFDVNPELIGGGGGIFDVTLDGELIFSKHRVGRFPENKEVLALIDSHQG